LTETIWNGAWTVIKKEEQISTATRATPVNGKIDKEIGRSGDGVKTNFLRVSLSPHLLNLNAEFHG
jgi:hypothetical protein